MMFKLQYSATKQLCSYSLSFFFKGFLPFLLCRIGWGDKGIAPSSMHISAYTTTQHQKRKIRL